MGDIDLSTLSDLTEGLGSGNAWIRQCKRRASRTVVHGRHRSQYIKWSHWRTWTAKARHLVSVGTRPKTTKARHLVSVGTQPWSEIAPTRHLVPVSTQAWTDKHLVEWVSTIESQSVWSSSPLVMKPFPQRAVPCPAPHQCRCCSPHWGSLWRSRACRCDGWGSTRRTSAQGDHKHKIAPEISKRLRDAFVAGHVGVWQPPTKIPRWNPNQLCKFDDKIMRLRKVSAHINSKA